MIITTPITTNKHAPTITPVVTGRPSDVVRYGFIYSTVSGEKNPQITCLKNEQIGKANLRSCLLIRNPEFTLERFKLDR